MKNVCVALFLGMMSSAIGQTTLRYVPAPPDNPLKGLVPYAGEYADRFPHSMEFSYLPLSDLMTGPDSFNWGPLEQLLNDVAGRRHQTVFRIWLEYPGNANGIPKFLEQGGLKVTEWLDSATEPSPPAKVRTPDYSDPRLRKALRRFIGAMGEKYDGDPRIGFITAGLLGVWGEWHTYPRAELMASKDVQAEVIDAYEVAFRKTRVLLRYPAGANSWAYAANHDRGFGYHDDSFAWATVDTGREADSWFFMPVMKAAGPAALNKWRTSPIGGEIRPELWGTIFDEKPQHRQAQDFSECVRQTHASWLLDTGMFKEKQPQNRVDNAVRQVQKMGYEFHVASTQISETSETTTIMVVVRNTGVAPFYYDWKVELAALRPDGSIGQEIPVDWTISRMLPGETGRLWKRTLQDPSRSIVGKSFAVRIENPMQTGLPLRFANHKDLQLGDGWLKLPDRDSH